MGGGKTSDVDFLSTNTVADGVAGRRLIPAVLEDLLLVANDAILVQEASIIAGMRMLLDNGRRRLRWGGGLGGHGAGRVHYRSRGRGWHLSAKGVGWLRECPGRADHTLGWR